MAKIFLIELDCSKFETMRFLMNPLKTSPKPTMCSFYELVKTFFFLLAEKRAKENTPPQLYTLYNFSEE